jgi:ATP/maltotriose-dependent transcriptional regulator MalT
VASTLLTTKPFVPPIRPEWVPCSHLVERLSAGLGRRKLTLVSGLAGSGKTSLVATWLSDLSDFRVAWLSLDEADNDPLRFFAYLAAALRTVDLHIREQAQRLLESTHLPPVESLVTCLINDIAGQASPLILVWDDYHSITELAIHEAVGFLVDRQPPQMHLVVTTRHAPPLLPLSRLRGRGQMTELRQSDLRFTSEEATAFLNRSMRLQPTSSEVAALEQHTKGWITGLQLAALSMQGRGPVAYHPVHCRLFRTLSLHPRLFGRRGPAAPVGGDPDPPVSNCHPGSFVRLPVRCGPEQC